ncbi:MAG: TRAP transporter small permease [Rhodovulum sp.]|nr:TRAP transporter small permease [Rhodovulum sp.]
MGRLIRLTQLLAAASLGGMVAVVTVDVFLRYAFNRPIAAGIELVELAIVGTIFMALPGASARRIHVSIDYLDDVLPPGAVAVLDRLANGAVAAGLVCLVWHLVIHGLRLAERGETSATLQFSAALPVFLMAAALLATAIVHLCLALLPRSP